MSGSSFASMGAVGGERGRSIASLPTGEGTPPSTRGYELREQPAHPAVDLVPDGADLLDRLPGGIGELPVEVPLPWIDGARVAAAHGDHDVDVPRELVGENLRARFGQVDAHLAHRLNDRRVERARGLAPRRGH